MTLRYMKQNFSQCKKIYFVQGHNDSVLDKQMYGMYLISIVLTEKNLSWASLVYVSTILLIKI